MSVQKSCALDKNNQFNVVASALKSKLYALAYSEWTSPTIWRIIASFNYLSYLVCLWTSPNLLTVLTSSADTTTSPLASSSSIPLNRSSGFPIENCLISARTWAGAAWYVLYRCLLPKLWHARTPTSTLTLSLIFFETKSMDPCLCRKYAKMAISVTVCWFRVEMDELRWNTDD